MTEALLNDQAQLEFLAGEAVSYASTHGLVVGYPNANDDPAFVHAPCTLLPTPVPRAAFEGVASLAPLFSRLVDTIARRGGDFLVETLKPAAQVDDFLGHLLRLFEEVRGEDEDGALAHQVQLGIFRSDYMLQAAEVEDGREEATFLQVELNTISASFGCLCARLRGLQAYLVERHLAEETGIDVEAQMPENAALTALPKAMAVAHELNPASKLDEPAVVMMIVQPGEKNSADQRWLEYSLWQNHRIHMIRRTFQDIAERASVSSDGGKVLRIDGRVVTVAYFRAGYTPRDFTTQAHWDALATVEKSAAVKCPSVAYHLAGTKKVQQELCKPGVLEQFVTPEEAKRLRTCFAGQWGLGDDSEETEAIVARAIENPGDFVLKPQREGGGNNVWGQELSAALRRMSVAERSAYILMERIRPAPGRSVLMRNGKPQVGSSLSELGIFGVFVGDGTTEHLNERGGHILRTKFVGVDEGGVAAGFACLDTPLLV